MMARASRRLRPALLLGCAACGLGAAGKAEAQAFTASPTTVAGNVTYDRATPGVETITVNTPSAIIRWSPVSPLNPYVFLPAGNTATFINGINTTDFAVLNRIATNNVVEFDGTVLSRIQDFAIGTSRAGGTVIFEAPGGILIGSTALFDVGNLVLTSLTVTTDAGGNFIDPSGAIAFAGGDKAPTAAVITQPGARINALNQGSYVAMIAPVIQHGGATRVNGSAAYVAAEQVELRVNAGLFDIVVGAGSANATPLVHTGSTGGPASTGPGDVHRIYMVAVPKNQAITAILQGNVGFDAASSAAVENGAIILSAGYSVAGGEPDRFGDFGPPPVPGQAASFHIEGGTISSDLFGYAVTDMLASGAATGNLAFLQDVSLFGGARAHLFAGPSQTVTVGGNAFVSTARARSIDGTIDLAGGEALIFAQGGSLDISGNATLDASAKGLVDTAASTAGSGTGGTAGLYADGGTLRIRGATTLRATGDGGTIDFAPDRGGAGTGGTGFVEGRAGGTVTLDGTLAIDTSGTASRSSGAVAIPGAVGTGGTARVAAVGGGVVNVSGAAALTSNGTGGNVVGGAGVNGGIGLGGAVSLLANGSVALGDAVLTANGVGGAGPNGGTARGGTIMISATPVGGAPPSTLTAADVTGTASATGASPTGNTAGEWHVVAGAGSRVVLANLSLVAAVNGTAPVLPFSSLEALRGRINVTQVASLTTPADIRVIGDGAGTIDGGRLDLNAGGDVTVTHSSRGANFTIDMTDLNIAGRAVTVAAGSATRASNRTNVAASGAMSVAGRMDGREIVATAASLDLSGTGSVGTAATDLADLRVTGNASVAGTILGRNILVASNSLGVTGSGIVGGAATDQNELRTTGNSTIAGRVLGRSILITTAGFDESAAGAVGDGATQLTDIRATGNASVAGTVLGRTINVQGATLGVAGSGTVGGAGSDQVRLTSLGNAGVDGRVLGRDIQIASTDLDLTGVLGDAGTQVVTLQISPTAQAATLGGTAQGPGYTLTGAEAGRIRADTLRVNAPALGANPALLIHDLAFNGGGAAAGIGTLAIVTPGIARVDGNLLINGARAADGISLTATARLEVVTPTGSVRVRDAAGAPAGSLTLGSNNLWVASAALIDRLRLDPNFAGRGAALLDSGGTDVPRGYVEAGGVTLNTGGTLFVQNTAPARGTFATGTAFAGITAGPGGLTIRSSGTPATVTAFGRRLNGDGSFTTGYDYFFAVNFQTAGGAGLGTAYTGASTFNTCIIVAGQCPAQAPLNAVPGRDPTTGPTGGADAIQLPPGAERDELVDTSFAAEPLIEEPVISGGESLIWNEDCDHDHDGRCDEVRP